MFYEDVKLQAGETLPTLVVAYGHPVSAWRTIWADAKNDAIRNLRGSHSNLQAGDTVNIKIDWKISKSPTTKPTLTPQTGLPANAAGADFAMLRSGAVGQRLNWVQTVNPGNQPLCGGGAYVDPCSGDAFDAEPFFYTAKEFRNDANFRRTFNDLPGRDFPSRRQGTTNWRAIVSIAAVTDKRVTVFESHTWGFDIAPSGALTLHPPTPSTKAEINGHLALLKRGSGGGGKFKDNGWTFRLPPAP